MVVARAMVPTMVQPSARMITASMLTIGLAWHGMSTNLMWGVYWVIITNIFSRCIGIG